MKELLIILCFFLIGHKALGQPFKKLNVVPGQYKIVNEDSIADNVGSKEKIGSDIS